MFFTASLMLDHAAALPERTSPGHHTIFEAFLCVSAKIRRRKICQPIKINGTGRNYPGNKE